MDEVFTLIIAKFLTAEFLGWALLAVAVFIFMARYAALVEKHIESTAETNKLLEMLISDRAQMTARFFTNMDRLSDKIDRVLQDMPKK